MSLIRPRAEPPREHPAEALLAATRAAVDQAVAVVDSTLRDRNKLRADEMWDRLLEVRHALRGKRQEVDT